VSEYLQARLKAAVLVDNDVNLMALGEARTRPANQSPLLFAKVSTGIGCGVVTSDGMPASAAQTDRRATSVISACPGRDDVICGCGNIGCVEAVASTTRCACAACSQLPDTGAESVDDLVRLVRAGDRHAVRLVREAAAEIGEVIAMVVHMFNPAAIVLGGRMARISDDLLAGVRAVVYRRALPLATRSLLIENTALNQYAGAIGGTVLGIERALSSKGIASILHSSSSST
jgi:predicted NBD/HSP70 family sugar kinase